MKRFTFILYCFLLIVPLYVTAQRSNHKNLPYVDYRYFHLGFHIGCHMQDLVLTNTGGATDGEIWFAEVSFYSPGFSVGLVSDMYLNPSFNLRFIPTLHFGSKNISFVCREEGNKVFTTTIRSNYLSFPLNIKYNAFRIKNYRPYLTGGIYGAFDIGRKEEDIILLAKMDWGIELGFGCDVYLPFFKLCPEIKLNIGFADLLIRKEGLQTDKERIKYTNALSKATSRMITFTFNFE
ncbi:porin family protein [Parabacteroides sp. APC149_11_2_Y6]